MKPFLILQLRPEDEASDNEFSAFLKYGGLSEKDVHRVRMEKDSIPNIDLKDYSGIILGGGPSNVSDKAEIKKDYEKRFEHELNKLFDMVFKNDFPFLGVCYGIGAVNKFKGGVVSKEKYSEPVGTVEIELTENSKDDDLLKELPEKFMAYCGHKEACQSIPEDSILLAQSSTCPYQMVKFKNNIYAMQFHTELDEEGILLRIEVYKNYGYYSPEDADVLVKKAKQYDVIVPNQILKRFVEKYKVES
ncbi:MAG: glutamine amidotransferase [Flavobacteriaceae bacterium]|nr:glutamine amidotransferase [Bacteroidia bacterium]NNL16099.1 glutamine amidotransferase [Flavobacteriaceae bacterium]